MRIRRLTVNGFGNLRGDFIFSSDRCNLVLEPNESGKSTLAAAILAALYGFPKQRVTRDRPIKPLEQYRPWTGSAFGLEMELTCREMACVVRRDFDKETVSVHDGQTGRDITAQFSRGRDQVDVGEALTGLSRDDFARCCFVGQKEIDALREAEGLTHALQRLASSQQGDVAAGEALAVLSRAVERDFVGMRLGRGKVDTEIKRLEKEIDELRSDLEAISSRRRASEDKIRRLEEATQIEGRAEAGLSRVDYLNLLAARKEVEAALQECAGQQAEIEGYRAEIASLSEFRAFPAEKLRDLTELKGRIESLEEGRSEMERRLVEEAENPLRECDEAIAALGGLARLGAPDAEIATTRLAVLQSLWKQRQGKKQALRREERRLAKEGVESSRVKALGGALSGLSQEERQFLARYREQHLEARAGLSEAERDRIRLLQAEGGERPAMVSLASARRSESLALAVGFVSLVLSPILWFALDSKVPALLAVAAALVGLLIWVNLSEKRPVPGAEQFGTDLQKVQTDLWSREKEMAGLQERLSRLAARLGRSSPEQLLEEFRELEMLQEKAAPLASLAAAVQEIQTQYAATASEILELMQRAGRAPAARRLTPRGARRFRDELIRSVEVRRKAAELRARAEESVQELGERAGEVQALRAEFGKLLAAGGMGGEVPADLGPALARFAEAAARRERLDRLSAELLPAAERRHAEPPAVRSVKLRTELEVLRRQIERQASAHPELADLAPDRTSREYVEERRRLQEEIRTTQKERIALSEELGDVLKEYRRDYPGRQALLATLEAAHARAVDFRDAVATASEVLTAISREAYAEWADVLNEKTSDLLRRLIPTYDDVRFDTDLSFTLRDARTGRRLDRAGVDAHLSAGARDLVYLAVRLSISEYLSAAGTRLPFILDDPFATLDDRRFESAMQFLLESPGRRHQIILLSCHEGRHRRWQESAPAELTDRLRILDLTPLSA